MRIKELEEMLKISRSNIRFYEKQGLFTPERKDNNYRDYTESDVEELKRIIVLRKMGFTVEEIRSIDQGELDFKESVENARIRLENEIEQLNGSLKMLNQASKEHTSFEEIDTNEYWEKLTDSERSGEKFIDICKDYLTVVMNSNWPWFMLFLPNPKKFADKYGVAKTILFFLALSIGHGIISVTKGDSFWYGFLYDWMIILTVLLILFPIYLLKRKSPKVGNFVANTILILGLLFIVGIILLIVILIINSIIQSIIT